MPSVTNTARGLRQLLAGLMVIAAVLFIVGVSREHALHHSEAKPAVTATEPVHSEGGGEDSLATGRTTETPTETHHETASEGRVLGVDIETWPLVIAFALLSLGLAIALLCSRSRAVVGGTGLVAAVAAVFDIAEIAHQANESRTSLVAIAVAVATLHVAAVSVAALILKAETPRDADERINPVFAN